MCKDGSREIKQLTMAEGHVDGHGLGWAGGEARQLYPTSGLSCQAGTCPSFLQEWPMGHDRWSPHSGEPCRFLSQLCSPSAAYQFGCPRLGMGDRHNPSTGAKTQQCCVETRKQAVLLLPNKGSLNLEEKKSLDRNSQSTQAQAFRPFRGSSFLRSR